MEHNAPVSTVADLSAIAINVVAQFFLPIASIYRRPGDVFFGAALDIQRDGGGRGGGDVFFQRIIAQPADVAQSHRYPELDALGSLERGKRVARGWPKTDPGSDRRFVANAGGRAGNDFIDMDGFDRVVAGAPRDQFAGQSNRKPHGSMGHALALPAARSPDCRVVRCAIITIP